MALLSITEYARMAQNAWGGGQMPAELSKQADYGVTITASSTQSPNFQALTTFVRLNCDQACCVSFGTNPTAITTAGRMSPNQTDYRSVPEGGSFMVAVISTT